jgi:hypothetical protein
VTHLGSVDADVAHLLGALTDADLDGVAIHHGHDLADECLGPLRSDNRPG